MAWTDEAIPLLRGMIGDTESPVEYSDNRLTDLLYYAAFLVVQSMDFTNDYTVVLSTLNISPDPTSDISFLALVCLKTKEMIAQSEYKTASLKAYNIKDGQSSIDGRAVADAKKQLAMDAKKEYDDASYQYQAGNYTVGESIVSPFRTTYNDIYPSHRG
jgi:hypothetical protein